MAKILLVEDDNNLREIYGARLTAEGYDIVSAPDGEEALAIAVKEKPDLIITDVMMPKISGFDMLDILRNAPETKNTKVIMMTALSQAEDKERADKLGADLYLVKSQVTLEDVAASVKSILEGSNTTAGSSAPQDSAAQPAETNAPPAPVPEPSPAPPQPPTEPAPEPTPTPSPAPPAPAPTPEPPAAPPTSDGTKENQNASASISPTSPAPPAASDDNAPQPQQTPPEPVPASPPVEQSPAPTPPPAAKKIEVVLPDANDESKETPKPADEKPAEPPKPEEPAPVQAPDISSGLNIGPTLAEALAEEEKTYQGSDPLPKQSSDAAATTPGPAVVVKPQNITPEPAEDNTPPQPAAPKAGGERVIQPINDPTKGPDLNQLLAEEEAKGQSIAPPAASPPSPSGANPTEHPDDFSKISL